ncbi:hypothetical protein MRX96_008175 [Rhipicephalus microplus]
MRRGLRETRHVEGAMWRILARGTGCPTSYVMGVYEAMVMTKAPGWRHTRANCARSSTSNASLVLWTRLPSSPCSVHGLTHVQYLYSTCGDSIVVDSSHEISPRPPPHKTVPLPIGFELPGLRSKRSTPVCAITEEAIVRMDEDLAGRTQFFTDVSARQDYPAAVAYTVSQRTLKRPCRLVYHASSISAELVGIHLAADIISEYPQVPRAVILTTLEIGPPPARQKRPRTPHKRSVPRGRCTACVTDAVTLSFNEFCHTLAS